MTDWMLSYVGGTISSQHTPEDLKGPLNKFFALFRRLRDEFPRCFWHRRHRGRREPTGSPRTTGSQLA